MINEDFCSSEVSKLLKEKGFNEPVTELNKLLFREGEKPVLRITHQKAMKWLREVHKVNIEIHYNRFGENYKYLIIYKPEVLDDIRSLGVYFHYEETVEAALKYVLENLI